MGNPFQSKPAVTGETPSDASVTTPPPSNPWLARGVEDVYYQREAQIGWWTVLGGVAIGALLTQLSAVASQLQAGRWSLLLYVLATTLIIANAWLQYAWGPLVVRWRVSAAMALLHFYGGFALCILSLQVSNPSGWMFAACALSLHAMISQVYLARSGAWAGYGPAYAARLKGMIWTYLAVGATALAAGLLLLRYPGQLHETVFGAVALLWNMLALWVQDQGMKSERAQLGIP